MPLSVTTKHTVYVRVCMWTRVKRGTTCMGKVNDIAAPLTFWVSWSKSFVYENAQWSGLGKWFHSNTLRSQAHCTHSQFCLRNYWAKELSLSRRWPSIGPTRFHTAFNTFGSCSLFSKLNAGNCHEETAIRFASVDEWDKRFSFDHAMSFFQGYMLIFASPNIFDDSHVSSESYIDMEPNNY